MRVLVKRQVKNREQKEGEHGRGNQAAHDDRGEGPGRLNLFQNVYPDVQERVPGAPRSLSLTLYRSFE
jgi:hypothetical protein